MQKDSKLFEDFTRLASGAAGGILEIKREIETMISAQLEKMLLKMNLATKEECDVIKEMASRARLEVEALEKRIAELEKKTL